MSRVEENLKMIASYDIMRKPSGKFEQIMVNDLGEIAAYLRDISKSLAIIADNCNKGGLDLHIDMPD